MQIECKTIPEATVIEAVATLTIPDIPSYAQKIIPMLLAEAEGRGMAITGPCIFTYEGCDGSLDKEFVMRAAFPVDECRGEGAFGCVPVPAHECLCALYRGPMNGLGQAWSAFTPLAMRKGSALLPIGREVYLHWIDADSPENLGELQIPLSA
jgi:effector-binding domain-containing protein